MNKRMDALEFIQTPEDFKYDSEEAFKKDHDEFLTYILDKRYQNYGGQDGSLPPLPIIINLLFEDMSGAQTLIFPEDRKHKEVMMNGVKDMIARYNSKKKIVCAILTMEAWMSKIDTLKENMPFKNELTEDQIRRKVDKKFRNNEVEKHTKIIRHYQYPVLDENNNLSTKQEVTVYDLFEDRILIDDLDTTQVLNSPNDKSNINSIMLLFDPIQGERADGPAFANYSIKSSIQYLQTLNSLLNA